MNQRQYFRVPAYIPLEITRIPENRRGNLISEILDEIIPTTSARSQSVETGDKGKGDLRDFIDWMNVLNQKLDTVINLLQVGMKFSENLQHCHVDISTSGLSFETGETYKPKEILGIRIILNIQNQPLKLQLYGQVVHLETLDNKNKIAVNFLEISEEIRNRIANFVFQREQDLLGRESE